MMLGNRLLKIPPILAVIGGRFELPSGSEAGFRSGNRQ